MSGGELVENKIGGVINNPLDHAIFDHGLRSSSARIERLYALIRERMTWKQKIWGDNLTVLDPASEKLPLVLRRAKALERTLLEMPITIEGDDFIVGNSTKDGTIVRTQLPGYTTEEERINAEKEGRKIDVGLSHKTPYYPEVLGKGLSGIISEIDDKISDITSRESSEENDEKLALHQAMRLECGALIALANRYARLAEELSETASDSKRRNELLMIAQVCRRVPELPASNFHEAVQSIWFIHYGLFSTSTILPCGRLDQYLYPAFKRDLEEGLITLEEAQEVIDFLWLRFNDRAQICRENFFTEMDDGQSDLSQSDSLREFDSKSFTIGEVADPTPTMWDAGHRKRLFFADDGADAINHWGQNILISGLKPDGSDGTNELTYLCLNALEKFDLTNPVVTVRLSGDSPPQLILRTAEVLKKGGGMPFIDNDDALIPGYFDLGVPIEDARDYSNSNCWETMIQGKSDQELIRGINFLLYLELALNRGFSKVYGARLGIDTGDPRTFKTFKELMDSWKDQMDHQLKLAIDHIGHRIENGSLEHSGHGKYCYNPLLSAITLDCLKRERDVTRGGARYTIWHVMGEAVANAIDSMSAIKKMVFEDNIVTMDELLTALENDWEGYENLRQYSVSRTSKFGNDDDYADDIGREMMDYFVERTRFHSARYPTVIFPCSVGTFSWYIMIGKEVGATPDGRHSREAVAANLSPAPGADAHGPTAAIRSYLKMRVKDMASGAPLDLRLSKNSLKGDSGTKRLAGFIKSFIDLGGNMLTLTVADIEELKNAMKEPEKYRHLRVRMGGWTAYFVMLSREQQRLHIQRVEHGLV